MPLVEVEAPALKNYRDAVAGSLNEAALMTCDSRWRDVWAVTEQDGFGTCVEQGF